MQALYNSFATALTLAVAFIPRLIGFIVILLVGWLIASLVSRALTGLLRRFGFDRISQRIGLTRFEQRMGVQLDSAGILGKVVFWFLLLIFLVPAADALGIPAVSNILNELIAYIPNVFVAVLVLFLGSLAGTVVGDIVRGMTASTNIGNPNLLANIARYAIIGFAALIALEQLQIATPLINELFGAIVLALALAFALAFGLGGQETARRWLNRGESTASMAASRVQQVQQMQQMQAQPSVNGQMPVMASAPAMASQPTQPQPRPMAPQPQPMTPQQPPMAPPPQPQPMTPQQPPMAPQPPPSWPQTDGSRQTYEQ